MKYGAQRFNQDTNDEEDADHLREIKEVQLMMSSIKSLGLFEEMAETSKFANTASKRENSASPKRSGSKTRNYNMTTGKKGDILRESMMSGNSKIDYNLSEEDEEVQIADQSVEEKPEEEEAEEILHVLK
jgi:hypothetical protein